MKSQSLTLIIILVLLSAALSAVVVNTVSTVEAVQNLQQQHMLVKAEDVSTVRPWMTIPYVAHIYEVPESYLYQSLHIADRVPPRASTLHELALRSRRNPVELVKEVQGAIVLYKRNHARSPRPRKKKPSLPKTPLMMMNGMERTIC